MTIYAEKKNLKIKKCPFNKQNIFRLYLYLNNNIKPVIENDNHFTTISNIVDDNNENDYLINDNDDDTSQQQQQQQTDKKLIISIFSLESYIKISCIKK